MFVITGAGGRTGGAVARMLLRQGHPVRVVLRPGRDGQDWDRSRAAVAHADVEDAAALAGAFAGARAVYVLNPPDYAADDMLASARRVADAYRTALATTGVRAVALSSIGAQHAEGTGNIVTTHILEQTLAPLGTTFVRPGNFLTNWLPTLPAMRAGVLPSVFVPLDRPIPHVAVADVARVVVRELHRTDSRTVELGDDYSPHEVAAAFATALGTPVVAQAIERQEWPRVLTKAGLPSAAVGTWTELWEGFNTGHIRFAGTPEPGQVTLEDFATTSVASMESAS